MSIDANRRRHAGMEPRVFRSPRTCPSLRVSIGAVKTTIPSSPGALHVWLCACGCVCAACVSMCACVPKVLLALHAPRVSCGGASKRVPLLRGPLLPVDDTSPCGGPVLPVAGDLRCGATSRACSHTGTRVNVGPRCRSRQYRTTPSTRTLVRGQVWTSGAARSRVCAACL